MSQTEYKVLASLLSQNEKEQDSQDLLTQSQDSTEMWDNFEGGREISSDKEEAWELEDTGEREPQWLKVVQIGLKRRPGEN